MTKSMYERLNQPADIKQQLVFLLFGGMVKRYHTVDTSTVDPVAYHSGRVAWLCHMLSNGCVSVNLLMAAQAHDLGEQVWGDIPSPAKRILGIKDVVTEAELKLLKDNVAHFELSPAEEVVLSVADRMDGMLACIRERRLGNLNCEEVYGRFYMYLNEDRAKGGWPDRWHDVLLEINNLWLETLVQARTSLLVPERRETDRRQSYSYVAQGTAADLQFQVERRVDDRRANSRQVGGKHYQKNTGRCPSCGEPIQHWDLYAMQPYLVGCLTKYATRYADKGGLEDLQKARHYLDKLEEAVRQRIPENAAPSV